MVSITAKPNATVTIEPIGPRGTAAREHALRLVLGFTAAGGKDGERSQAAFAAVAAREALGGFGPESGAQDRRQVTDMLVSSRPTKAGVVHTSVVGVEGSTVWPSRPEHGLVETLRGALAGHGYRVAIRERRECAEPACRLDAIVEWDRSSDVPAGWHSSLICGGHNYRTCSKCKSVYALSCTSATSAAPSVHCEVCGLVLIEWGSSKVWTAELVKRVELQAARAPS